MKINNRQEESHSKVGLYLLRRVSTHSQLHVVFLESKQRKDKNTNFGERWKCNHYN